MSVIILGWVGWLFVFGVFFIYRDTLVVLDWPFYSFFCLQGGRYLQAYIIIIMRFCFVLDFLFIVGVLF